MFKKKEYTQSFYKDLNLSSYSSAKIYINHLFNLFTPESVIDFGSGYGGWLKACEENGSKRHVAVDGPWNDGEEIRRNGFEFVSANLNEIDKTLGRFDLAISLEVAEHLDPESSLKFITTITECSDAILFSAAFTDQGGTHHINEQRHSYWAKIFKEKGFVPYDLFREKFWDDNRVGFWYRQNCFMYCKSGSHIENLFNTNNVYKIENLAFLDCVHPDLYLLKCGEGIGFMNHLKGIVPSFFRALKRLLHKVIGFLK